MVKKKTQNPSGFDNVLNNIYGNSEGATEVDNLDDPIFDKPAEDNIDEIEDPAIEIEGAEGDNADKIITGKGQDDDVPDDKKLQQVDEPDESIDNADDDDDLTDGLSKEQVAEAKQVSALFDAVGESLGWNMTDINEDEKPLTVDDLTKYLSNVVNENSIPQYADEKIQQLDEYVKNGGKFEDFYSVQQQNLIIDDIDLEKEDNQQNVIKELLRYNGYTDEQIQNKISRYQDADMLYEESEDALSRLKEIKQHELEENTRQQEQLAKQQYEQQQVFFEDVTKNINGLNDIRGISVPKEDRKALYDYIFKVDQSGVSQYQKEFNQNLTKNLIESAYFTMKGDALVNGAKRTGETSATEKLRKLLRHQAKNHTAYNAEDKHKTATDLLNGMF